MGTKLFHLKIMRVKAQEKQQTSEMRNISLYLGKEIWADEFYSKV